jgi:hypothetical protein
MAAFAKSLRRKLRQRHESHHRRRPPQTIPLERTGAFTLACVAVLS